MYDLTRDIIRIVDNFSYFKIIISLAFYAALKFSDEQSSKTTPIDNVSIFAIIGVVKCIQRKKRVARVSSNLIIRFIVK